MKGPEFTQPVLASQEKIKEQDQSLENIIEDLLNRLPDELRTTWEVRIEDKDDKDAIKILESVLSARDQALESHDGQRIEDPKLREELDQVLRDLERTEQLGLDVIGQGNYGRVHVSPHSDKVCVKYLTDEIQMESHQEAITKEFATLESLQGFVVGGVRAPYAYVKGLKNPPFYIGMERIHGKSLKDIKNSKEESQDLVEIIRAQNKEGVRQRLTHFLEEMHLTKRIVHGDIHGGNVMLDREGNWYLIDYGLSQDIEFNDDSMELKKKDFAELEKTLDEIYESI